MDEMYMVEIKMTDVLSEDGYTLVKRKCKKIGEYFHDVENFDVYKSRVVGYEKLGTHHKVDLKEEISFKDDVDTDKK